MNEAQSALLLGIALGFLIQGIVDKVRRQRGLNPDKRSAKIGTLAKSKTPPSPAFALGFFVLEPSP